MVGKLHSAHGWLSMLVATLLLTGCSHWASPHRVGGISTTAWQPPPSTPKVSAVPAGPDAQIHARADASAARGPAVSSSPLVVRGQNTSETAYGGQTVAALPNDPLVGPRYTSTPTGSYAVQPVQYVQPQPPYGAAGSPIFQPPGTGVNQTFPAQPTMPYGGIVAPTAQPPFTPASPFTLPPDQPTDLELVLQEAQTGRLMFGVGINSDAGLVGNVVIDEQNFDIMRWPTGLDDWLNGTAFRGAGQRFRLEALPGTQVQRYSVSFSDPYFLGTNVSFGASGFYYERNFTDWEERRFGGRLNLGYIFPQRPDLSTTVSARYEQIDISNPRTPTPPELLEVLGENDLVSLRWEVAHDTRDNAFLPSQGHLLRLSYEQAFGTFTYPKFEGDYRRYFVMRERPDGSGRHVLGLAGRLGVAGSDTPIYENFYAGGFSTLRGFEFRGASPMNLGVIVGGEFMLLTSAEYRFPLTADDNLYGSFFVDAGTVEESVEINNFRVTPGFELRVNIPALGPVPLAIGFGVPIVHAPGDDIQNFHFFVGVSR